MSPVSTARAVAPFCVETLWTQPFGRYEDQLVADVPVPGQPRSRREPGHLGAALRRGVFPHDLEIDAGPEFLPAEVTARDDARARGRHEQSSCDVEARTFV
jgi:hypothetical protein